jgi:Domain of unknown function (DUF222)
MEFGGSTAGAVEVKLALADLGAALDVLTGGPWWALSEGELSAAVVELHRLESRVAAAQVGALGEAISRGVPAAAGAVNGAGWLRGLVPVTPSQARARAELAEALPFAAARPTGTAADADADRPTAEPAVGLGADLGPTRAAFDRGELSAAQAGVLVRTSAAIDAIPGETPGSPGVDPVTKAEALALLVDFADRLDVAQLGKAATRARYLLDRGAARRLAKDEDAQQEARSAYLYQDPMTGMWHGELHLPPVEGALVNTVIEVLAKPRPAQDGSPDLRTSQQRHADAFVALAQCAATTALGQPGSLPSRHGAPVRLVATADLATLKADLSKRYGLAGVPPATIATGQPGGWVISPLTAQVLACDAEIVPMIVDEAGRALDVGDTIYPFPPRIRRAIEQRDRHCTYPGCTAQPSWCHAHHLTRHPDGPTSEANGTLLCGRHHRFIHAKAWTGRIIDGHVVWKPPGPDHSELPANAHTQHLEHALKHLARRWLTRNPELRDTG